MRARAAPRGVLEIRPVTRARWDDFARLFAARGAPHYCWCTPYRFAGSHRMTKEERREAMRRRVASGAPVGLLAYEDGEPVGWCSVAPRESYEKLGSSTSMPRVADEPTWTILCLFVPRARRGEGVAESLVAGAVDHARREGATFVEAYPWDAAGISSRHRGRSSLYEGAGFRAEGRRYVAGPFG